LKDTTFIDDKAVISPYIGGGYLYITDEQKNGDGETVGAAVVINPGPTPIEGVDDNIVFEVRNNGETVIGLDAESGNAYFKGTVYATNGEFTGTVNATDGNFKGAIESSHGHIGGWKIGSGKLESSNGKAVLSSNGDMVLNGTVAASDFSLQGGSSI
jgi:hypothetical protein